MKARGLLPLACLLATARRAVGSKYPIPEPSPESGYRSGPVPLDLGPFEGALAALDADPGRAERLAALLLPESVGVPDVRRLLSAGELTSADLVAFYVRRIRDHDAGVFNSVAQLNPSALVEAIASDESRSAGSAPRGALEGVPVLVKWNVAVAGLETTAGAVALAGWVPSRDAFLVGRLRASGAVVLGHANLSEWANYVSPVMPDGFSAMGGQTRPAYGLYDPSGSSSGSAVAVSAGFAPLAVGTETYGSIISPSMANGVVGLRPSTGLVSPDLVIPLCSALDTAGPMARSVEDLAVTLTAMTGVEEGAAPSPADELKETDFAELIAGDDAGDIVVGIPAFPANASSDPRLGCDTQRCTEMYDEYFNKENARLREVEQVLKDADINVTTFDAMDLTLYSPQNIMDVLEYCFRESFDGFASSLASTEPTFPRSNLAEVVSFNNGDPTNYVPYGQDYIKQSAETQITADEFARMENETIADAQSLLDSLFSETGADVILSMLSNSMLSNYAHAIAGYPALTVPGGYSPLSEGGVLPEATVFTAPYLGEKNLLRVGYVYEQGTKFRVNPDIEATGMMIKDAGKGTAPSLPLSPAGGTRPSLLFWVCPIAFSFRLALLA